MATAPGNNSNDDLSNFGANDWLIEEMFEAWKKDPNSVDTSWREFFDKRAGQATPQAAPCVEKKPQGRRLLPPALATLRKNSSPRLSDLTKRQVRRPPSLAPAR